MDYNDGEIYVIQSPSGKYYVGQVRCYVLNRGKRIYKGTNGRWLQHVSEANSLKKKQCWALNNSIKKYGKENFMVKRLMICDLKDLDYYEKVFINKYNCIAPNGYNLTKGGKSSFITEMCKEKISESLKVYFSKPENRLKQSIRQYSVTNRAEYKRKNKTTFYLPKYVHYFERNDGRKGFSVTHYKSKNFSNSNISLEERYNLALSYLERINGQSAANLPAL